MRLLEPSLIKKTTSKPLRLSIVLFFIGAVLSGLATPLRASSQSPVTFERFSDQMLKQHDVDHVTAYKSGDLFNVEVFLKKESLNKSEYADAKRTDKSIFLSDDDSTIPQYFFQAATYDGLYKQINDAETSFGYAEADKISVGIESGHESLLSNWLVQCVIMFILLIIPIVCGYVGYKEGKKRTIGSIAGLLLGIFPGPFGLIIVFLTKKIPPQKKGGIWV